MELSLPSAVGEKGPHRSPAQLPQGIAFSHPGAPRPALCGGDRGLDLHPLLFSIK